MHIYKYLLYILNHVNVPIMYIIFSSNFKLRYLNHLSLFIYHLFISFQNILKNIYFFFRIVIVFKYYGLIFFKDKIHF